MQALSFSSKFLKILDLHTIFLTFIFNDNSDRSVFNINVSASYKSSPSVAKKGGFKTLLLCITYFFRNTLNRNTDFCFRNTVIQILN